MLKIGTRMRSNLRSIPWSGWYLISYTCCYTMRGVAKYNFLQINKSEKYDWFELEFFWFFRYTFYRAFLVVSFVAAIPLFESWTRVDIFSELRTTFINVFMTIYLATNYNVKAVLMYLTKTGLAVCREFIMCHPNFVFLKHLHNVIVAIF